MCQKNVDKICLGVSFILIVCFILGIASNGCIPVEDGNADMWIRWENGTYSPAKTDPDLAITWVLDERFDSLHEAICVGETTIFREENCTEFRFEKLE